MLQLAAVIVILLFFGPSSVFWVDLLAGLLHQTANTVWTMVTGIWLCGLLWGYDLTGRK